jgi:mitochondrial fission protein ELM1
MIAQPAESAAVEAPADPPRVWCVAGYRAGERSQILGLAEALGWPFEVKTLIHRPWDWVPGLTRRVSLAGVDRASRAQLAPPWPDLVISAGMRNEPVCRWIKARSGGRTRLVQIGRPWVHYRELDLVITTPQYRLPERHDVLQNLGTIHRVTPQSLAAAAAEWAPRFAALPRPRIGVIVGGHSGPYTLGPGAAARLGRMASARARAEGGSLLITTSSRTPPAAAAALLETVSCPHYAYVLGADAGENPYLGILAEADALIVTGDSIAMLSEAVAAGKPVSIFDLDGPEADGRLGGRAYRWLMRHGHPRLTRDLTLFHDALIDSGRAAWLHAGDPPSSPPPLEDIGRAVERVRRLLGIEADGAGRSSLRADSSAASTPISGRAP